jgi:hypothetical protein
MDPVKPDDEYSRLVRFLARYLDAECADVAAVLPFVRPRTPKPPGYYQVRYTITYLVLLVVVIPVGLGSRVVVDWLDLNLNTTSVAVALLAISPLAYFAVRRIGAPRLPAKPGSPEIGAMLAKMEAAKHGSAPRNSQRRGKKSRKRTN